jgi:NADH-quinone oxidoreductase subunit G
VKGSVSRSAAESLGAEALRFYDAVPADSVPDALMKDRLPRLVVTLQESRRPAIVCGTDIVPETTPDVAADNASLLRAAKEKAGLFYVMPGGNAFGAALLSSKNDSLLQIVEAIENGSVKALVLVESDPFSYFPDRQRLEQAIRQLDHLLVLDHVNSKSTQLAQILLPTMSLFEEEAAFINQEGRLQFSRKLHPGGIPIEQISGGGHPPRTIRSDIPGGEPKAGWQILAELAASLFSGPKISIDDVWIWLAQENPVFANTRFLDTRKEEKRLNVPR